MLLVSTLQKDSVELKLLSMGTGVRTGRAMNDLEYIRVWNGTMSAGGRVSQ